eukprot:SAG31_NODE_583_length_13888_cov_18.838277_6_plen_261_part_00
MASALPAARGCASSQNPRLRASRTPKSQPTSRFQSHRRPGPGLPPACSRIHGSMCPPTQCCCCPLYKGVRIWTWIFIVLWLFSAFAYISVGVWLQRLEDECAGTRVRYAMAGLEQNLSLPHTADENGSAVMTDGLWRDAAVVRQMRKETLLVLVWRLLTHVCSASKDSWDVPNAAVCEYEGPEQYQNSIGGRSVYRRASSSVWRRQRWNACSAEFGQSAALASIGSSAENELVRRACGEYDAAGTHAKTVHSCSWPKRTS